MCEPEFRSVTCPVSRSTYSVEGSSHIEDDVGGKDGDESQHEVTTVVIDTSLHKARNRYLIVRTSRFSVHTINVI